MLDNRKHEGVSLKEKLLILLEPSNLIKLVKVQQDELKAIQLCSRLKTMHTAFVEYLYEHYIIQGKPKTYLC